jgi:tousled-like kinase
MDTGGDDDDEDEGAAGGAATAAAGGRARRAPPVLDAEAQRELQQLDEQEEIYKLRLSLNQSSQKELSEKLATLESQKKALVRTQKLHWDYKNSRFNYHPMLNDRYILLDLLGKGGFSEVYKGYDVVSLRFVACKIHQLNPAWSESRKISYTRHAVREYEIHKTLKHQRVVQLYDVFAIDVNAFCTVLEHCDGSDLDMHLKVKHTLQEKEARCIIMQVFAGLKYLNEQKQKIIHYDLKPGNILFHQGSGENRETGRL